MHLDMECIAVLAPVTPEHRYSVTDTLGCGSLTLDCQLSSSFSCRKANDSAQAGSKKQKMFSKSGVDEQADLQFGRVEVGQAHGPSTKRQKKKKPSKEQLLQEAVQKQQQKADDIEDFKVSRALNVFFTV